MQLNHFITILLQSNICETQHIYFVPRACKLLHSTAYIPILLYCFQGSVKQCGVLTIATEMKKRLD